MPEQTLVSVFFLFQILGGHLGMALILGTIALSKKVQRNPFFISFLASWVMYTTSFCLLLYTGHQFDIEKPLPLCITQLSMIYGSAILTPLSALMLIFNIWMETDRFTHQSLVIEIDERTSIPRSRLITTSLVTFPYAAFVLVAIFFALEQGKNPSVVDRSQGTLYCSLASNQINAIAYLSAMIVVAIIVLEGLILLKLIKSGSQWPKGKLSGDAALQLFIRIGFFTVYGVLSLIAAIVFCFETDRDYTFPHIIQAMLPTAAFVIFGTQRDLLNTWGIILLWNRLLDKRSVGTVLHRNETFDTDRSESSTDQAGGKPFTAIRVPVSMFTFVDTTRRSSISSIISISSARM